MLKSSRFKNAKRIGHWKSNELMLIPERINSQIIETLFIARYCLLLYACNKVYQPTKLNSKINSCEIFFTIAYVILLDHEKLIRQCIFQFILMLSVWNKTGV